MKSISRASTGSIQVAIFLLIIFFLPTQLGLHFWPSFSVVAGQRLDYLSPTIFFTDALIVLLLWISFIGWLFSYRGIRSSIRLLVDRISDLLNHGLLSVVFFTVLIIGIFPSSRPLLGIYSLLKLGELIFFARISARLFAIKNVRKHFFSVLLASMLVQSVLTILQFNSQGSIGGIFYFLGERTFTSITPGIANASLKGTLLLRPYGTLPHPNVLGGYLLIGLILIFSEFNIFRLDEDSGRGLSIGPVSKLKKVYTLVAIAICSIAMLLSMSRSAIFVGASLVICWVVRIFIFPSQQKVQTKKPKTLSLKYYVYALLLLCISVIIFSPVFFRFTSFDLSSEAFVERKDLAFASLRMFLDYPIFGVGLGNFLVRLPEYISLNNTPLQPVHNIYLLTLAEVGTVGAAIITMFFYSIFMKTKDLILSGNNTGLALVAVLLLGLADHYFLTLQQGRLLFALVVGTIISDYKYFRPKRSKI